MFLIYFEFFTNWLLPAHSNKYENIFDIKLLIIYRYKCRGGKVSFKKQIIDL